MISELIQKMQELADGNGNYHYQVIKIDDSQNIGDDIMASYECTYDQAREIEGLLSTNFSLNKSVKTVVIAIKRVAK